MTMLIFNLFKKNKIPLIMISALIFAGVSAFFLLSIDNSNRLAGVAPTLDLDIPHGALPEGIMPDDIYTQHIVSDDVPEKWQWLNPSGGFVLEPAGLKFNEPITFVLTLPSPDGVVPLLYLVGENEQEVLAEVETTFDPFEESVTVTGKIAHFSLIIYDIERAKDILDQEIREGSLGAKYLEMCKKHIEIIEDICSTYENWRMVVDIVSVDWTNRQNDLRFKMVTTGPNNQCLGIHAGSTKTYPLHSHTALISAKKIERANDDYLKNINVVCQISCNGWSCPAGEAEREKTYTCREGTYRGDGECEQKCKPDSCIRDHTQYYCFACNPCDSGMPTDLCERNCPLIGDDRVCQQVSADPDCSFCIMPEPEPAPAPKPTLTPTFTPEPTPEPTPVSQCDKEAFYACFGDGDITPCMSQCPLVLVDCPPGMSGGCYDAEPSCGDTCAKEFNDRCFAASRCSNADF